MEKSRWDLIFILKASINLNTWPLQKRYYQCFNSLQKPSDNINQTARE
jgi:hypothetical protein